MRNALLIGLSSIALSGATAIAQPMPPSRDSRLVTEYTQYACRMGRQQFATTKSGRRERVEQSREEDPIAFIKVDTMTRRGVTSMSIAHVSQGGVVYDRSVQYTGRTQRHGGTYQWHGTLIRDNGIRMVGVLNFNMAGMPVYTETRYDRGHFAWSVTAPCEIIEDEERGD